MMRCCSFGFRIGPFLRDYDFLQYLVVILIYVQIGCALVGSLGAFYNGVLLINLAISLFALVAIESSSQSLGRTYAILLACAILLDTAWFILFSKEIWNIPSNGGSMFVILSVKLALLMQTVGFSMRLLSSLLWIQMYRLGVQNVNSAVSREADYDLRNSFLNPASPATLNQHSERPETGGAVYDPCHFSSLFEGSEDNGLLYKDENTPTKDQAV